MCSIAYFPAPAQGGVFDFSCGRDLAPPLRGNRWPLATPTDPNRLYTSLLDPTQPLLNHNHFSNHYATAFQPRQPSGTSTHPQPSFNSHATNPNHYPTILRVESMNDFDTTIPHSRSSLPATPRPVPSKKRQRFILCNSYRGGFVAPVSLPARKQQLRVVSTRFQGHSKG